MSKEERYMPSGDGIKLKTLRINMGLTVAEFSVKANINPSFVNLLEKGCMPLSNRDKKKIGEAFSLEENWFELLETSISTKDLDTGNVNIHCSDNKPCDTNHPSLKEEELGCRTQLFINNGESLRKIRLVLGLSRKDIAEAIGITSVQIGYIETGKRALTDKVMVKLNSYFSTLPKNLQKKVLGKNDKADITFTYTEQVAEQTNYNTENNEILIKLKMIKKECGYTQSEVSQISGVNRSQLSMIENGKMHISKKVKIKLLHFINTELVELENKREKSLSISNRSITSDNYIASLAKPAARALIGKGASNKTELLKVIQSMKRTRDELQTNINILEQALNNISI